ncbi:hypothetical protein QVD17_27360 [Tagetes erecta]|uniref:PB1-like domain-containing protein n=1 Tax=Tagetes erecta TaxID=13708 RepID=A0AAD8NRA6_TARER|nr:hypothetical protein QVD17_27360 [Tagetes erecta]
MQNPTQSYKTLQLHVRTMAEDGYYIRESISQAEVDSLYVGFPNLFSIKLHHGGSFHGFPGRSYVRGKIDYVDLIDIDKFSVHDMNDLMLKLGHREVLHVPIFYSFLVPEKDLDIGLSSLDIDLDFVRLGEIG